MGTRLVKLLILFVGVALFESVAFPLAANHGRLDLGNKTMQPYLILGFLALVFFILLIVIVNRKPLPHTTWYNVAKVSLPMIAALLVVNLTGLVPMKFTIASSLIFLFHIIGILIAIWLSIRLLLNKELNQLR